MRLKGWLFGVLAPALEVGLVMAGLLVLGWEGVLYTLHRRWTIVRMVLPMRALGLDGGDPVRHWLAGMPVAGVCIVAALLMFFLLPPAYAHD